METNSRHTGHLATALILGCALALSPLASGCGPSDPVTWHASDAQESDSSSTQAQRDPIPNPYADEGENVANPGADGEVEPGTAPDEALTATNPDGVPVAESMPYKGMPARLIDDTWMGPHDLVGEPVAGGLIEGATPYRWCAENGTGDVIYTAYVLGGEVVKVQKDMPWSNYWAEEGSVVLREYPDLDASGERVESDPIVPSSPPDPTGYASPEEYADNVEDWFRSNGSADPWNDAYVYWEGNAL